MSMIRRSLMLPRALIEKIEDFRRARSPIPSEARAVRELIEKGLACSSAPKPTDPPPKEIR